MRATRRDRRRGAWLLFCAAACALLVAWSWQCVLVEVFEPHADTTQECSDDDVAPAVPPSPPEGLATSIAVVELTLRVEHEIPPSVLYGPAPKVPKHLA